MIACNVIYDMKRFKTYMFLGKVLSTFGSILQVECSACWAEVRNFNFVLCSYRKICHCVQIRYATAAFNVKSVKSKTV